MNSRIKYILNILLPTLFIWILGYCISKQYNTPITQIILLPIFTVILYYIFIFFHEFMHFITARILNIEVKGFCCKQINIYIYNNRYSITLKKTSSTSYDGCTYIKCDMIKNENDLINFRNKILLVSLSAPITNYLVTLILLYLNYSNNYQNILIYISIIISIILTVSATIGDIYTTYQYMTNRDFLINMLLDTDIISNSYNHSDAKEYLQKELIKSINILKNKKINTNDRYKLIGYKKLLYLCIIGEIKELDLELFINMKNKILSFGKNSKLSNLDEVLKSNILVYSVLFYKFILKQPLEGEKLKEFCFKNKLIKKSDIKVLNNIKTLNDIDMEEKI